jgi:hypothetical protein
VNEDENTPEPEEPETVYGPDGFTPIGLEPPF